MSRALEDATTRFLASLTSLVGVAVAAVLPTLCTAAADAPSVGAAALTLGIAGLLALALRQVLLTACLHPVAAVAADGPPPLLPGRVTDPVHHPVRPRAPGLA
jgi:hypothetical protein